MENRWSFNVAMLWCSIKNNSIHTSYWMFHICCSMVFLWCFPMFSSSSRFSSGFWTSLATSKPSNRPPGPGVGPVAQESSRPGSLALAKQGLRLRELSEEGLPSGRTPELHAVVGHWKWLFRLFIVDLPIENCYLTYFWLFIVDLPIENCYYSIYLGYL